MSKILILGSSGFIGKALALKLAEKNKIVAFSRNFADEFLGIENIATTVGSFEDIKDFSAVLDGVDCVIHLISTTVPSDDTEQIPAEIEQNVIPTVKLLESMVHCGVKKILFASSAGAVYGETGERVNNIHSALNPYCGYGVQKAIIEMYIKFYGIRYGLDYRIMRISNPYGVGQDSKKVQGLIPIFVRKLINEEPISIFGGGENMRDYIYLPDLIEGIIKVMEYAGDQRVFNLGYGTYFSINEVVSLIEEIGEKKFVSVNNSARRNCDVYQSYVDMEQCHLELNWFPDTDLRKGIARTLEAIQ